MKRMEIHAEMDETTRQAREALLEKLRNDPRIIRFLQTEKQDGQFLEQNAGAMGRYLDSLDRCSRCRGLEFCRQPMKGRGLAMQIGRAHV